MIFIKLWRCAGDFPEIQNGRLGQTSSFFVAQKLKNLKVRNYLNFLITFPMIWKCASLFFLSKFKMASASRLFNYLWAQKLIYGGDAIELQASC